MNSMREVFVVAELCLHGCWNVEMFEYHFLFTDAFDSTLVNERTIFFVLYNTRDEWDV